MPDFTRFDFHVVRFMYSETVKQMSAEEVGQYILLLCDAWIMGKEVTLPNDHKYLARVARVDKVSPLVLSKFEKVEMECGTRLRNPALYKEWQATMKRSESARERGKIGNEVLRRARNSEATATQQRSFSDPLADAELSPIPNHTSTNSNQPRPTRSTPKEEFVKACAADDAKSARENEELKETLRKRKELAKATEGQF